MLPGSEVKITNGVHVAVGIPQRVQDARDLRADLGLHLERGQDLRPAIRQPKVFGRVGRPAPADPTLVAYRLICRPALAEIVGDGRPWTVLMISLLSMPWRYLQGIDTEEIISTVHARRAPMMHASAGLAL